MHAYFLRPGDPKVPITLDVKGGREVEDRYVMLLRNDTTGSKALPVTYPVDLEGDREHVDGEAHRLIDKARVEVDVWI